MKKILLFFLYFYSFVLILVLTLIYPFIRIKIGEIRTKCIGNSTISYEIFYHEIKEKIYKKKFEIYIWYTEKKISNNFLLNKIRKKFLIFPGILLHKADQLLEKYNLNYLQIPIRKKYFPINLSNKDKFKVLRRNSKLINFETEELEYAYKICKIFQIQKNDKIVCASARTPKYKNEKIISTQNADINSLMKGFDYLIKNNYKILLMGDSYDNLPKHMHENIISYSNSKYKNDMLDFYFVSRCDFFIQTPSGIGEIAGMMRKPRLIINFWGLENLIKYEEDYVPLVLPKKIKSIKNAEFIHYLDQLNIKFSSIHSVEELNKKGYELINNNSNEILAAIIEMIELINSKNDEFLNTKQKFWNYFNQIFGNEGTNKIKIVDKFYNENIQLFEKN